MITIQKISEILKYIADIEYVIFDLDDTLYSEKEYVRSGFSAVGDSFPFIDDLKIKLWNAFRDGKPAIDFVLSKEGYSELKEQAVNIYREHYPEIALYPDAVDTLIEIKTSGKKIGIITDGRPNGQRNKIDALHLRDYVDEIIITDELGGINFRKPCDEAFIQMHDRFQSDFKKMCYVGDNLKKDFISPEKLGMMCIFFDNKDGLYHFEETIK